MNVTKSLQEEDQHQHLNHNPVGIENEEEPIVTSTSNDLSLSSPVRVQQQPPQQHNLESVKISPPRITSSTGNDSSISPPLRQQQQGHPQQEELQLQQDSTRKYQIDLTGGSSEDDTGSQNEFSCSVSTQQKQGVNAADTVIPTSANATLANNLNPNSNTCIRNKENPELVSNTVAEPGNMVTRNISGPAIADSGASSAVVDNATPSVVPINHKIMLKLPRPSTAKSESQMYADPTTSNSSSNSSNNSCTRGGDTRKVEPLKINLHNTHGTMQQHNVPKITIKPIIKKPTDETYASCSSSTDDDPPILKLTIKSSAPTVQHCSNSSEPHIVPKLIIRSASSEEGIGASNSASILPRLTIKRSDPQSTLSSAAHNNVLSANSSTVAGNLLKSPASMTSSACSTPFPPTQQPSDQAPLPKLTIKTSMDGTSNSILSHISPASLSNSSTSSSYSASIASLPLPSATSSIPKLTIKHIPKSEELVVPKLTIKTNAVGNSECASTSTVAEEDATASKIPKLTIKTGQEHAVIITQHSAATHAQFIPKITIKTKSLDVVESGTGSSQVDHSDEPPPEKIPKITIKTNEILDKTTDAPKFCIKTTQLTEQPSQQPSIPKLTITVSSIDFGGNGLGATPAADRGPQSPLIVRQLPGMSRKMATKSTSPERVPKLMISRQDSGFSNPMLMVSNRSNNAASMDTKIVPKLTIKTCSSPDTSESKDSKTTKFSIKTLKSLGEVEKIPKLTIKSMPTATATTPLQHSSEESDECVSLSSCSSPVPPNENTFNTKIVPKLTIKNLSSPQPTVKTVGTPEINMPASKKCTKNTATKNDISAIASESTENATNLPQQLMEMNDIQGTVDEAFAIVTSVNDVGTTLPTTNGGESSSSQEFCGFNDNTTDSNIEESNLNPMHMDEETPRRHSDDMDIDEALQQQHSPQTFNNVGHFSNNNEEHPSVPTADQQSESLSPGYLLGLLKHPKLTHVIDTVDLTSSPSPGSSPAHFNYADTDAPEVEQSRASDFLLERLQQHCETGVIQQGTITNSHTILLSKFTSHPNPAVSVDNRTQNLMLPVLQAKPDNCISNSEKYPYLTERLLANGIVHTNQAMHSTTKAVMPVLANVILDSIEILDTPDGSPHSSLGEESIKLSHHMRNTGAGEMLAHQLDNCKDVDSHNNNNMMPTSHAILKRHVIPTSSTIQDVSHLERESLQISPNKLRRIENDSSTMATITILTNDIQEPTTTVITTSPTMIQSNHCREVNNEITAPPTISVASHQVLPHRSRKQKHEYLLTVSDEEQDPLQLNLHDVPAVDCLSNTNNFHADATETAVPAAELSTPTSKRRGRPRKGKNTTLFSSTRQQHDTDLQTVNEQNSATPAAEEKIVKPRLSRVQLLRKRLAIDMVDTEQLPPISDEQEHVRHAEKEPLFDTTQAANRDRTPRTPLRTSRRSITPNALVDDRSKRNHQIGADTRKLQRKKSSTETSIIDHHHQHFGGGSNSCMSSCSTRSLNSKTTAATVTMAAQIDLTMSSSSSSNGSNTVTTVEAGVSRAVHSMLPPTTILSSSDPLADVVFRPNDFSSLVAAQQLRSPTISRRTSVEDMNMLLTPTSARSRKGSRTDSQEDGGGIGGSVADNSGDDSASSSSGVTPGRSRGRGRGRNNGIGRGFSSSARIGRGASAVTKAIAMSRPRCVGGLKHTPDPERIKGLFSPSPQVFEEDTRMSADLNQVLQVTVLTQSSGKQLDFLTNEESQSSIISTNSILDPNTVAAVQNGSQVHKRPKKKKMEVCVAQDTEIAVGSIAEYDWPPPKGCCPSKNRDTFMIQEQVALYLGIKSFKRKYPDLPRRQVDMEERNWLQEKGLVSEKMCDLGITAVWASDILDIMYTDFYEKYEEYKEFIRQKHVREIESKQKALGLNVMGRGLQARDRAMLSASKWNSYFNKSRKDERHKCLDLQTLTVNEPLPCDAAAKIIVDRPMIDSVVAAVEEAGISETPPALRAPLNENPSLRPLISYPLALVPGQYCEKYRHYTPLELRSYPINTVLDDPRTLHERFNQVHGSLQMGSDTETESATETTTATIVASQFHVAFGTTYSKRVPVRRSRRARTNAIHSTTSVVSEHERTKDTKNVQDQKERRSNKDGSESGGDKDASAVSTTSSSESEASSSDTDSDSDGSCSSVDLEAYSQCGVCQRTQNRNLKNLPEVFLKCYTCRRKVHPSCIEMSHRMMTRARNYNWQCAGCKCCIKCKRKQDQNKMLFCEQCDRGFHIYCIDVKTVPEGRWSCERCSVCLRCGASKPEGLSQSQQTLVSPPNTVGGQQLAKPVKHKKVKWINEYRIDHITKLREHCSMLCVPCGRAKTSSKRNNLHGGGAVVTNSQMSPPPARNAVAGLTIA